MPTFFERREFVSAGDLLAEGEYIQGENTFREDKKIYASRMGLVEYENKKVYVIALKAFYTPKVGDTIIGIIAEVGFSGWMVDINSPYLALLRASDVLGRPFRPQSDDLFEVLVEGDLVIAKIISYDRAHNPRLTVGEPGLGKITHGQIFKITPSKIPRVIGRKGSMISMIKEETGCHLTLGHNGVILITGKSFEGEKMVMSAIKKIEVESHTSGLTDRIAHMFKKMKTLEESNSEPKK